MNSLEKELGYSFDQPDRLTTALTHSSYANESRKNICSNERLEFLGDSVLSLVVSDYLYKHYSHLAEGELTKLRASLVCEKSLSEFAKTINLGGYLLLGKGEQITGGAGRPSILADAFEAVIAAIYLDGGIEPAGKFIMRFVEPAIVSHKPKAFRDYKTTLQEIIQQNPEEKLDYILAGESGPDHDKRFTVEVRINSNIIGKGSGRTKKDAEQHAAREALELMGWI